MIGWTRFALVQILSAALMLVGWVLLAPMAYCYLYRDGKWRMLDGIYGNSEDGCTGPMTYNPGRTWWRTYLWSAWRNSTNNFNRSRAWKGGPFFRWMNASKTWYFQCGFRPDNGWPILSAGRHDGDFPY